MGLELEYIKGQTPLEEEEKEDLRIKTYSTRGELDEFEQANIEVDKYQIEIELNKLMVDCKFWIENHTFPEDEIAIRF